MKDLEKVLTRIAIALESINEKMEALTQCKNAEKVTDEIIPEQSMEEITYDMIDDAVWNFPIHGRIATTIVEALYHRPDYVSLMCAVTLSRFYNGVTMKDVKEAIENNEIKAEIPSMKEVEIEVYKGVSKVVHRTSGKYDVYLKGTILWLNSHGRCKGGKDSIIYKCLDRIINSH